MKHLNVLYLHHVGEEDVFAIFPDEIEHRSFTPAEITVVCYAHIGQHSAASFGYIAECLPADDSAYADLHAELSCIYETGNGAVQLEVLNTSSFHFSHGCSLSLEENAVGSTWGYPFSADTPAELDMMFEMRDCGGQGDQTEAVTELVDRYQITANVENSRDFLRGFGAWDDDDLSDHRENILRLTWLAGCGLRESGTFYMDC